MRRFVNRIIRFIVDREWVGVIAFVTAVVVEGEAVLAALAGELSEAGDDWSWYGLVVLAAGAVARSGVFSRASHEEPS